MSQRPEPDPFSLMDIPEYNPWWEDVSDIPAKSLPRTDLYWRVRNTLENDFVLIPGAPVTGTGKTLKQIIRALILGAEHDEERIQELFRDDSIGNVGQDGCQPEQVCFASCSDPLAQLVDEFVNEVRLAYHPVGAQTGELDFYLILEDVHRLDDWRDQLIETHIKLKEEFPEDWTIVTSVPVSRLAHETDFEDVGNVKIDNPHHTQKFRDTLVAFEPQLSSELRRIDSDATQLDHAREAFRDAALGDISAEKLVDEFKSLSEQIRDVSNGELLERVIDQYVAIGGFEPAIAGSTEGNSDWDESEDTYTPDHASLRRHISSNLSTSLYQDIPRLAKIEPDVPRIESPEKLHGMISFLGHQGFEETTYIGLGDFLSCDTRTIRQKFVPILEDLHIGERATRYDLQRNRTLRFFLRSPGYLTAFGGPPQTSAERIGNLRTAIADHLRRLLVKFDHDDLLQYWLDDDHLVDYVIDIDGNPVLFVSAFANETGGTVDAFEAFTDAVESHHLEVVITETESEVAVEKIDSDRLRLLIPHWLLLTIC